MAAPKGNQFWKLHSKHGRDTLFSTPDLMWEAACEYFQWCDDNPWRVVKNKTKGLSLIHIQMCIRDSRGYDIAYREYWKGHHNNKWKWKVKYGRYVDDDEILCWMRKEF